MSAYSDMIVIRHPEPGATEQARRVSDKPLVNAGDATGEHPIQDLLGVEMVSTGEVACFNENTYEAYLKALLSTGLDYRKKISYYQLVAIKKK